MFGVNLGQILANAIFYFICQAIASACLNSVIVSFPFQLVSLFPFKVKRKAVLDEQHTQMSKAGDGENSVLSKKKQFNTQSNVGTGVLLAEKNVPRI
jgi:hypothetical protein